MYTQGFGEVLTDIMTVNPAFSDIPSASSILDTSNYTFQAVTFGKDAEGFSKHAHVVLYEHYTSGTSPTVSSFNSQLVIVRNYSGSEAPFALSYNISATQLHFSSSYNSVPVYPAPNHRRLEQKSTTVNSASSFSSAPTPNLGHYVNAGLSSSPFSSVWNVIGAFPPGGYNDWDYFIVSSDVPASATSSLRTYFLDAGNPGESTSGELSGVFNADRVMDKNGYLTVHPLSGIGEQLSAIGTATSGSAFSGGALVFSSVTSNPSAGTTNVAVRLKDGDAASMALFGGFNHLGVWCLDVKQMLTDGLTPPFEWDALDNLRKYKLVSKVSFWDNLSSHKDNGSNSGMAALADSQSGFTFGGPVYVIKFSFT